MHTFIGDPYGDPVPEDLSLGDVLSADFPNTIENVHLPIILWRVTEFEPIDLARLRQSKLRRIDLVCHIDDEAPHFNERLRLDARGQSRCLAVQAKLAEIGITMTMTDFDDMPHGPQIL